MQPHTHADHAHQQEADGTDQCHHICFHIFFTELETNIETLKINTKTNIAENGQRANMATEADVDRNLKPPWIIKKYTRKPTNLMSY